MRHQKQKVMVIHDVSKEGCWSAIRWVVNGLSLKAGDELILLGVVHHLNDPPTLDFLAAAKQRKPAALYNLLHIYIYIYMPFLLN